MLVLRSWERGVRSRYDDMTMRRWSRGRAICYMLYAMFVKGNDRPDMGIQRDPTPFTRPDLSSSIYLLANKQSRTTTSQAMQKQRPDIEGVQAARGV